MSIDCCKSYVGKQIIGLLPGGGVTTNCLWYTATQDQYEYDCFLAMGWDFNGQGVDFPNVASTYGGYFVQNGSYASIYGVNDTCNQVWFLYEGTTAPPEILATDPVFGQYSMPWNSYCEFGCVYIPSTRYNETYDFFNFFGFPTTTAPYGGSFDFSDPNNVQMILEAIVKSYFPGATVIVQDDGGGYFTIIFQDVWFSFAQIPIDNIQFGYNGATQFIAFTAVPC